VKLKPEHVEHIKRAICANSKAPTRDEAANYGEARHRAANLNIINYTSLKVAEVMAADNPRFDRARFLKACGLSV
jgi:hypothetical protein